MSTQTISIIGAIGSFKIGNDQYNGITLKDVTVAVAKLPADTDKLIINVAGPGGHKETGDMIVNYLESLKSRMSIETVQVGDIGSISTKIFLVGDKRTALIGMNPETLQPYEWFMHNPWNTGVTGDAETLRIAAEAAQVEQDELASYYVKRSGADLNAIEPLMKLQTGITGEEALALGFATDVREALKTAAYMKNEHDTKTLLERVEGLIATVKNLVSAKDTLAMVLELDNGTKISVATEDMAKLEGVAAVTVDTAGVPTSTPVAPGSYKLKADGSTLTIADGKVTKVEKVAAPAAPDAAAVTLAAKVKELEALLNAQKQSDEAKKLDDLIAAKVAKGIEDFKATMTTRHRPPHKDVIIDFSKVRETPAQARNRENAERTAKQNQNK